MVSITPTQVPTESKRVCQCGSCPKTPLNGEPFCEYHARNGCPIGSPLTGLEPNYNPEEYMIPEIQHSHNCYAYALGIMDKDRSEMCRQKNDCRFHKVGKQSGHKDIRKGFSCPVIMSRTMGDTAKAIPVDYQSRCPSGMRKIAVISDERRDMHYLRQGNNGYFDHKQGGRAPTDRDANGVRIWRPDRASFYYPPEFKGDETLNYNNFCGYLCIPAGAGNTLQAGGQASEQVKRQVKQQVKQGAKREEKRRATRKRSKTRSPKKRNQSRRH